MFNDGIVLAADTCTSVLHTQRVLAAGTCTSVLHTQRVATQHTTDILHGSRVPHINNVHARPTYTILFFFRYSYNAALLR